MISCECCEKPPQHQRCCQNEVQRDFKFNTISQALLRLTKQAKSSPEYGPCVFWCRSATDPASPGWGRESAPGSLGPPAPPPPRWEGESLELPPTPPICCCCLCCCNTAMILASWGGTTTHQSAGRKKHVVNAVIHDVLGGNGLEGVCDVTYVHLLRVGLLAYVLRELPLALQQLLLLLLRLLLLEEELTGLREPRKEKIQRGRNRKK